MVRLGQCSCRLCTVCGFGWDVTTRDFRSCYALPSHVQIRHAVLDVTTRDFRSCQALPSHVQIRHAALSFKTFSASHPERLPSFSISSSPLSFSSSSHFLLSPSRKALKLSFIALALITTPVKQLWCNTSEHSIEKGNFHSTGLHWLL